MVLLAISSALALIAQTAPPSPPVKWDEASFGAKHGFEQVKPGPHVPMPRGALDTVVIRLDRGRCFGFCPIYSVEIRGDGSVVYDGKAYVLAPGRHAYRIKPTAVSALVARFRAADFWSLASEYRAPATDSSPYTLTLTIGGKTKTVVDYIGEAVGMPHAVRELEDAIDAATNTGRWISGDLTTLAALQREKFDFRSPAATLMLATAAGSAPEPLVLGLIDAGASPIRPASVPGGGWNWNALAQAASRHRMAIVHRLLAAGAPVDLAAMRSAIVSGDPALVKLFLERRPLANERSDDGSTLLHAVEDGGHNYTDKAGQTHDYVDPPAIIRLLIAAGADVNGVDQQGETPLHKTYRAANARAYLAAGAATEIRNKGGKTALDGTRSEDVALALLDAGVRPTRMRAFRTEALLNKWERVRAQTAAPLQQP